MAKPKVSAKSTAANASDDLKQASLTRDDVAKRLGVSISTVRRLEGTQLHPIVTPSGVRRFKPADVEQLAATMAAANPTARNAAPRAVERSKGDLAALVFERLEQRHSLAEIVIALRVPPDEVRELYHAWLVGLWSGELLHPEPALPARHTDQDSLRRVTEAQLAQLLANLPDKQPTRISIARAIGEYVAPDRADPSSFVEYRNLAELGGFVVSGPARVSEVAARVGAGEYRVSAYGFELRGLRWEVFVRLEDAS